MRYLRSLTSALFLLLALGFVRHNAHAAIAFDNATSDGTNAPSSTLTFSHAVGTTGTNRILFVGVETWTDSITGVTYNGSALTLVDKEMQPYNSSMAYLFYMVAPPTGTHDVVISSSTGDRYIHATAASYTGASQTGIPDASGKSYGNGATYSQSLTPTADNSWVLMMADDDTGRATGAGANSTLRGSGSTDGLLVDSNGPVTPAGSRTLAVTSSAPDYDRWAVVIASFKPAPTIGYDKATSSTTNGTASSLTFSDEVSTTGTSRLLFVGVYTWTDSITGVTYNGSAMTLVDKETESYNDSYAYLYYLVAPATGTHDVVVSASNANHYIGATAVSYTGASQTGVPDATSKSNSNGVLTTDYSQSITTSADNSWAVLIADNSQGRAIGAGSDSTLRGDLLGGGAGALVDTNGPISPAGSRTLTVAGTLTSKWSVVAASFKGL